jgi:septum formation protein
MAKHSSSAQLTLASASPRRLELLRQIGVTPNHLMPMDLDETPKTAEHPKSLAKRLGLKKAKAAYARHKDEFPDESAFILTADTVVAVGRRIMPKADNLEDAQYCLNFLSGRAHRVYTGLVLATPEGKFRKKLVETRVRFKVLSKQEMNAYLDSGDWRGKAGGYGIQGLASAFVVKLIGSYTNVVGLPLYETSSLLQGEGYPVTQYWAEAE